MATRKMGSKSAFTVLSPKCKYFSSLFCVCETLQYANTLTNTTTTVSLVHAMRGRGIITNTADVPLLAWSNGVNPLPSLISNRFSFVDNINRLQINLYTRETKHTSVT